MKLDGQIAIVTGGGGGIGGACVRALAQDGAHVVVTDISEDDARKVAGEIAGTAYRHDVTSEEDWQRIVDATIDHHGQIDVLVNCAGVEGDMSKGGLDTSLEEWRRIIGINLDGTFIGCRTVMRQMLRRKTGAIVNMSSITSFMATPTALAYGVSKAGVQHLTRSLALVGAGGGAKIRCNSVHPGIIKSRMTEEIIQQFARARGLSEAEMERELCAEVPFGDRGLPEDVAKLVLFLSCDDSSYITGSEFKVDGGWLLASAG